MLHALLVPAYRLNTEKAKTKGQQESLRGPEAEMRLELRDGSPPALPDGTFECLLDTTLAELVNELEAQGSKRHMALCAQLG